ncbi:MAG: response regulator [Planctomycetota bacterium]|jgi:signal transduction histidine kinase/CheY-like chemotaxis protein|nr:response regulator [Planctomycetota bacterium]
MSDVYPYNLAAEDGASAENGEGARGAEAQLSLRAKLIIIFLLVKVIPLLCLAAIAWWQIDNLGKLLNVIAVQTSRNAVNNSAVENIERQTTDAAYAVARFLYARDGDVRAVARLSDDIPLTSEANRDRLHGLYAKLGESLVSSLVRPNEKWVLAPDGMSWQPPHAAAFASDENVSTNAENDGEIDGTGFHHRAPNDFMNSRSKKISAPLWDEIAFIDLRGNQLVKYVSPNSTKKYHPLNAALVNVANRANTYLGAEDFWRELPKLGADGIYVSDVIGAYVPSHFVGMYTPKRIALKMVAGRLTQLRAAADTAAGADAHQESIAALEHWQKELPQAGITIAQMAADLQPHRDLRELVYELKNIRFDPENEAFAGHENPNGRRFEGIVRWVTPVTNSANEVVGYVSLALNTDHIIERIDHLHPLHERYTEVSDASNGNYAFIWDYRCRSIVHPRHHSICGFNPDTGKPETPWLETSMYRDMLDKGYDRADWQDYIAALPDYQPWTGDKNSPAFQSRAKRPAAELTALGLVGLDGRYLNNAPQCTGWMDLTGDGGSGSFYILWSGLYKLTTAAAIPYYTGQYSPEAQGNRRGFGFIAIGAGLDDFQQPVVAMGDLLHKSIGDNLRETIWQMSVSTLVLIALVIGVAIWMASFLTKRLTHLTNGISRFRAGERYFRFRSPVKDEFGLLADCFDDMADNIVNNVNMPLVITDSQLRVIYVNDICLKLIKMTLNQARLQSYAKVSIYPYHSEYCPITALRHGGESKPMYFKDTDAYYRGLADYVLEKDGSRVGYIITSIDVTEITKKNLALKKAVDDANRASAHKSEFLRMMSHEIRTPLNAIIGMTRPMELCVEKIPDGDGAAQKLRDDLVEIKKAARHLLRMLNDILDLAKIENGTLRLQAAPVNMADFAQILINIIEPKCLDKQLSFTATVGELSAPLVFDGLRLRQVLMSLLSNAVKFTERGAVHLQIEQTALDERRLQVRFSVRDTGVGIAPEAMASLFNEFESGDREGRESAKGIGIGLALAQKVVNLFGGEIKVASAPAAGSEFYFTLWFDIDEKAASALAAEVDVTGIFANKRALMVDDIEVNRLVMIAMLEETGMTVEEANDGDQALKMFCAAPNGYYDIIFMDIRMPTMDGYAATRAIRSLPRADAKTLPIVAVSANAYEDDVQKSLASGMNAHIAKPVESGILARALMKYLK